MIAIQGKKIMKTVKGGTPEKISPFTRYQGCAFYFSFGQGFTIGNNHFDNCSFRTNVDFLLGESCRFDNCNFRGEVHLTMIHDESPKPPKGLIENVTHICAVGYPCYPWSIHDAEEIQSLKCVHMVSMKSDYIPTSVIKVRSLEEVFLPYTSNGYSLIDKYYRNGKEYNLGDGIYYRKAQAAKEKHGLRIKLGNLKNVISDHVQDAWIKGNWKEDKPHGSV